MDTPPQTKDTAPERPSFTTSMRSIGAVLGWLSGALAGLGAVFCAFGYLATRSHLYLLGVDFGISRYDYIFYVQRGAGFFLLFLVETAPYLFLSLALVLAVLFALRGWRWFCERRAIGMPFNRFAKRLPDWRGIAYVGLLVLLALQVRGHLRYPEWMDVSGILDSSASQGTAIGPVREWMLSGNQSLLRDQFTYLANQQLWIGALLGLAWWVTRGRRWALLRTAPFAVVLVVSLGFLAGEFGALALPLKFRAASIRGEQPPTKMYLIDEIQRGYVFWDCAQKRARWIPIEKDDLLTFSPESRTPREILEACDGGRQ